MNSDLLSEVLLVCSFLLVAVLFLLILLQASGYKM